MHVSIGVAEGTPISEQSSNGVLAGKARHR